MNKKQDDTRQWVECPVGTLTEPAARIRRSKTTRRRAVLGGGVALLILVAGTQMLPNDHGAAEKGSISPSGYQEPNYGGITCTLVRQNAADYKAGHLNNAMCTKMEEHVGQCVICTGLLTQQRNAYSDPVLVAMIFHTRH